MISKRIDLFRSHAESCVRGDQDGKSRGILNYIKSLIIDMIEYDSDITPKRVLNQLTIKRKKDESEGKSVCLLNHLPSLKQVTNIHVPYYLVIKPNNVIYYINQVQGFMRRHNKLNYDNKIELVENRMKNNQYSENLMDDDCFFLD